MFTETRRRTVWLFSLLTIVLVTLVISPLGRSFAQGGGNDSGQTPGASFATGMASGNPLPPPPSTGSEVPLTYFGPLPSEVQKELVGPVKLLRAGTIDVQAGTITLPLYLGHMRADGKSVWYILTDTTDKGNAEDLGLNWSPKLAYAGAGGRAVRDAFMEQDTSLTFQKGTVDFSPERQIVPGDAPNFFPPKVAKPGSVGDDYYTPIIRITNVAGAPIYNAPVVAFGTNASQISFCNGNVDHHLVLDRVVKICPGANGGGTVTLKMTPIFSFAKPAMYISTDASDPVPATLDNGTFAPAMAGIKVGRDDSFASAIERLFVTINGPTGVENPQRQGLNSALSDKDANGDPLPPVHVIGGIPTVALDYSPLWDLNLGEWTKAAVDKGYRARIIDEFQYLGLVQQGWITGPMGKRFGSTGIVVNCPIVMRFL